MGKLRQFDQCLNIHVHACKMTDIWNSGKEIKSIMKGGIDYEEDLEPLLSEIK